MGSVERRQVRKCKGNSGDLLTSPHANVSRSQEVILKQAPLVGEERASGCEEVAPRLGDSGRREANQHFFPPPVHVGQRRCAAVARRGELGEKRHCRAPFVGLDAECVHSKTALARGLREKHHESGHLALGRRPVAHEDHVLDPAVVSPLQEGSQLALKDLVAIGAPQQPVLAELAWWLMAPGTALRIVGELLAGPAALAPLPLRLSIIIGGVAQVAGLVLIFLTLYPRIRATGSALREAKGERF